MSSENRLAVPVVGSRNRSSCDSVLGLVKSQSDLFQYLEGCAAKEVRCRLADIGRQLNPEGWSWGDFSDEFRDLCKRYGFSEIG